jgi:hypothetical protein
MVTLNTAEGWCTDPYGQHDARWLSGGTPTALVRDGALESFDLLPDGPAVREPTPISWGTATPHGVDLLRSDQPRPSAKDELRQAANGMLTRTHD